MGFPMAVEKHKPVTVTKLSELRARLTSKFVDDDSDFIDEIAEKMLEASTLNDLYSAADAELEDCQSILGTPILVTAIKLRPSDFEDSYGFWCIVDCIDSNSIMHKIKVGGKTASLFLWRLLELKMLPHLTVLIEKTSRNASNSYYVFRPPTVPEQKLFDH